MAEQSDAFPVPPDVRLAETGDVLLIGDLVSVAYTKAAARQLAERILAILGAND